MEEKKEILSSLELKKIFFEKIEFNRLGFRNENHPKFSIESQVSQNIENRLYKVSLSVKCLKEDEYDFKIILAGIFSFSSHSDLKDDDKEILISRNTIAILMPFMRSQISLLTAQPDTDCIVLPPFNINEMINKE